VNTVSEPNKFRPAASGAAMTEDDLIGIVKHLLSEFGHDSAPLVQKIAAGTATREQITRLGIHFQNFTRITPNVLGSLYARCYDHAMRRKIMDNLIDEDTGMRCGDQPHYELAMEFIMRFAGLSWDQVASHPIPYEVQDINNFRLRTATQAPIAVAMGAFGLAGEAGFSAAAAMVSDGLREHYGVKDEDQVSWIVHIEGDEEHSEVAEAIVRKMIRRADDQQLCIRLCAEYLDRWQYLYGVAEDPGFKLRRSALRHFEDAVRA
jgi:pyrroloquinoline quinone (PQQ) biosynthesis protein C